MSDAAQKRRAGRPPTHSVQVKVLLRPEMLRRLDAYSSSRLDRPCRAESLRQLAKFHLDVLEIPDPEAEPNE